MTNDLIRRNVSLCVLRSSEFDLHYFQSKTVHVAPPIEYCHNTDEDTSFLGLKVLN